MTILAHSRTVPTITPRVVLMPDALKTDILKRTLATGAIVAGHCDPVNALYAANHPGVDVYASAGVGRVECYSATATKDGANGYAKRHYHLLRFDCRVTVPGQPCQFFALQCSDCPGFSQGGCRHASAATGLLNHFLLHETFRAGGRIVAAYPSHCECPQCPPVDSKPVQAWRIETETPGRGFVTRDVCIGLRGGAACQWGKVA